MYLFFISSLSLFLGSLVSEKEEEKEPVSYGRSVDITEVDDEVLILVRSPHFSQLTCLRLPHHRLLLSTSY